MKYLKNEKGYFQLPINFSMWFAIGVALFVILLVMMNFYLKSSNHMPSEKLPMKYSYNVTNMKG
ncbi:MAG: hypothetical protein Q8934_23650 [Bacillota bacterium]|nr:hypothetical protein [Bacillota bacterium]